MRARVLTVATLAVAMLFAIGCDSGSALIDPVDLDVALKRGPHPIVATVTGSGHATIAPKDESGNPIVEPFWRTFTLTARAFADGTVQGRFQYNSHEYGTAANGSIECLTVNGNTAVVKARVDRFLDSGHATPDVMWFVIVDGEPDLFSPGIPASIVGATDCSAEVAFDSIPMDPSDSGEFKVRSY